MCPRLPYVVLHRGNWVYDSFRIFTHTCLQWNITLRVTDTSHNPDTSVGLRIIATRFLAHTSAGISYWHANFDATLLARASHPVLGADSGRNQGLGFMQDWGTKTLGTIACLSLNICSIPLLQYVPVRLCRLRDAREIFWFTAVGSVSGTVHNSR